MKPKILVTREVFDETLAYLGAHCEVDSIRSTRRSMLKRLRSALRTGRA